MLDKQFENLVNQTNLDQVQSIISNLHFSMTFGDITVDYNLSLN